MSEDFNRLPGTGAEAGVSAYLHKKSAAAGVPLSGTFELTRRCNFNCRMCYVHAADSAAAPESLTAAQWLGIAEQAANEGMLFLLLTGGEPLIRADFEEIYRGLQKLGVVISLNTNGSLLTGKIAALFERLPPSRINVTLYGASEKTYQAVCGVERFSVVAENIDRMRAAGVDVRLNVSATPQNAADLERIGEFAAARGLRVKATSYMYPPVRRENAVGENPARFTAEQAGLNRVRCDRLSMSDADFRRRIEAVVRGGFLQSDNDCIDPDLRGSVSLCRAGRAGFWVDHAGGLRMCGMLPPCADLTVTDFRTAWQAVRRETERIRLPAACTACALRPLCPVCAAACFAETGAFGEKPAYLCTMTAAAAREMLRLSREQKDEEA